MSARRYGVFAGQRYYARGGERDFYKTTDTLEQAVTLAIMLVCSSMLEHTYQLNFWYEWWQVVDLHTMTIVHEWSAYD